MYQQYPNLQQEVEQHLSHIHKTANKKALTKKAGVCSPDELIVIPVVVHILYDPENPKTNISEVQIASQICQLNIDYGGTNQDLIEALDEDGNKDLVAAIANAASEGTCIEFCLASFNHPQSNILNPDNLVDGEPAIIRRSLEGLPTDFRAEFTDGIGLTDPWEISPIWDRNEYLNFWVVPSIKQGTVLGLGQLPNGPFNTDGIIIRAQNFGASSPDCSDCEDCFLQPGYDWGRTATHEVGHWLGLFHTWGNELNSCGEDDGISDTPLQFANSGEIGCNIDGFEVIPDPCTPVSEGGIMYMNYMDYSADACLILFSNGQEAAMEEVLRTGFRSNFGLNDLEKVKCQPTTIIPPIADFAYSPDPLRICNVNGKIKFKDISEGYPTLWGWRFEVVSGDIVLEITVSESKNPVIGVLSGTGGSIEVRLEVGNPLGTDDFTQTISVELTEEACPSCEGGVFAGEDVIICPNEAITLSASLGDIDPSGAALACEFLRWEVSGFEVGTSSSIEVNSSIEGTVYYTAVADCQGFICRDEVAVNILKSGTSTITNTLNNPYEVCGDEVSFQLTSTGPYHYDTENQTIAWGIWVIEDPFNRTGVHSAFLPGSPPNDDDVSDDTNFINFYNTDVEGATGEGTVDLFVFGNGATYYFAPIVINKNNTYSDKCIGVSPKGTYVKQYLPLSTQRSFNSCLEESDVTIEVNGGLPLNDFNENYTLSLYTDVAPNMNLIPDDQRSVSWNDAVINFESLSMDNHILTIEDELGCQVIEKFSLLDCEVAEWEQIANINGLPVQLFTDNNDRVLEGADDFWVLGEGMSIEAVEVTGSFSRTNVAVVNSVHVKISVDADNQPGTEVVFEADIVPSEPSNPNFHLSFDVPLELPANKYWISILPKMSSVAYGQWFWNANATQTGDGALYRDPFGLVGSSANWTSIKDSELANPNAKDFSFALLSNASAGSMEAPENNAVCCGENLTFRVSDAQYDCTSFRLAYAMASSNDLTGLETAIEAGNTWFGDENDAYEFDFNCIEDFEEGTYYVFPFLANKYESTPKLLNPCGNLMGEGQQITWKNCTACGIDAGTMPAMEQWICSGERTDIQTSNAILGAENVLTYILHNSPSTSMGQVFAQNDMGYFDASDVGANLTLYYVSAVVGPDADDNGIPDFEDECTVIAVGTPVRFLNEIAFEVEYDVSASPNRVDAVFTIRGGVSELNASNYLVNLSSIGVVENAPHGVPFVVKNLPNNAMLTLEIQDENDCSNVFEFTDIERENIFPFSFILQPIPTKDFLQMSFTSIKTAMATINLYGVDGRLLLQQLHRSELGKNIVDLDLQSLPSGMYFLSLEYEGLRVNRKVVKE